MSAEFAPTEDNVVAPNKAQAIVELNERAAHTDMTNEQYETTRASIDAAHAIVDPEKAETKKPERPIANAAALLAIHQAAAQNNWDDDRIAFAERELERREAAKQ